jgi:hypothetical protein
MILFSAGFALAQEPLQPHPPEQPLQPVAPEEPIQPAHPWEEDLKGHPPMLKNEPETIPAPGPALPVRITDERLDTLGNLRKMNGLFYSFSYGWQQANVHSLNRVLRENNFPEFNQFGVNIGMGGYKMAGKWIFGGEGHLGFYNEKPKPFYDATLTSGSGFIQAGYRIVSSSSILFYPLIGIGGGVSSLKISEEPINGLNFYQYLSDPGKNINLSSGNAIVSLSLNLNYFTREVTLSGFHLGISAGYFLSLPSSGWYTFNANLEGGPGYSLSGAFLRLRFGGGSFSFS